jgi:hypothetical protein
MTKKKIDVVRTPVTDFEVELIETIHRCANMPFADAMKRFISSMSLAYCSGNGMARHNCEIGITDKQRAFLASIAYRFRRQVPSRLKIRARMYHAVYCPEKYQ